MTTANPVHQLADELLELSFTADPLMGTILGIPGHDDTLGDRSEEAQQAIRAAALEIGARADALDPAGLSADDAVTRAAVAHHAGSWSPRSTCGMVEYTITDLFVGPAAELLSMLPMIVLDDAAQAGPTSPGCAPCPAYLETVAERHRAGVAAGRVPVAQPGPRAPPTTSTATSPRPRTCWPARRSTTRRSTRSGRGSW